MATRRKKKPWLASDIRQLKDYGKEDLSPGDWTYAETR